MTSMEPYSSFLRRQESRRRSSCLQEPALSLPKGSLDSSLRWRDGVVCTWLFILRGGDANPHDGFRGQDALRRTAPSHGVPIFDVAGLRTRILDSSLRCAAFGMTITVRRANQGDENGGFLSNRHSSEGWSPGNRASRKDASWIPASAGMTNRVPYSSFQPACVRTQGAVSIYSHGDNLGPE